MTTVGEAQEAYRAELEDGIPARRPSVLIEAARRDEKLLPKPDDEDATTRFMTQRMDPTELEAQLQIRNEQLVALQDLVSPRSKLFELVKAGNNDSPNICIGRARKNDIVLIDSTISSLHAVIEMRGDRFLLRDHKSKNGTFVNQKRVGPTDDVVLTSGDCLRMGDRIFYYLNGDRLALFLELRIHAEDDANR